MWIWNLCTFEIFTLPNHNKSITCVVIAVEEFLTRITQIQNAAPKKQGDARGWLREADDEEGDGGRILGAAEEVEPTLPALRRLHLAAPISFGLFLQRLCPLASGLTHVHLLELLAFDYDMVRALHLELAERGIVPARTYRASASASAAPGHA